jgi:hypothetical protein
MEPIWFVAMTKTELNAVYKGWQRALASPVIGEWVNPFTKKTMVAKLYYPKQVKLDVKEQHKIVRQTALQSRKLRIPQLNTHFVGVTDVEALLAIAAGAKLPPLRPMYQLGSGDGEVYALPPEGKPALADLTDDDIARCAGILHEAVRPVGSGPPRSGPASSAVCAAWRTGPGRRGGVSITNSSCRFAAFGPTIFPTT